ncbi:sigma-70 family RNA polymerase sigma factor [Actinocrispum wychmicini]|uniref:RNA polymerase sigma-70 factor (ECF subfamily) n=1 Tax=Actinocrispum wychmicini TaxID=1213861 RepID=A0A4R2J6S2_9PSEU|nr:sigma-70 family RNA polymerase sigma factor [Actinocrispum wychmicini]TCO50885.1 RNA polymerase sigma-70 factor (ECF subfamily) [Actinocrispum wychmicini]
MNLVTVSLDTLAAEFSEHRAHLLGVAYRLTSTLADAEDAVQEAWLRLSTVDHTDIRDLRGWLTTVVGRICLDRLRSAAVRREHYTGPWLPEPVVTSIGAPPSEDPLDTIVRQDGVRMAALVVLDKLTPEQRVAFVLHDAFSVPFDEIAEILSVTTAAARQHASRGRKALADADPPPRASFDQQRELLERVIVALTSGDLNTLVELLHPDVHLVGDANGKARTALRIVSGPDKVARFLLGLMTKYGLTELTGMPMLVNGDLGLLLTDLRDDAGHQAVMRRVTAFAVRDGKIAACYDVVNPDKLTRVPFPEE